MSKQNVDLHTTIELHKHHSADDHQHETPQFEQTEDIQAQFQLENMGSFAQIVATILFLGIPLTVIGIVIYLLLTN